MFLLFVSKKDDVPLLFCSDYLLILETWSFGFYANISSAKRLSVRRLIRSVCPTEPNPNQTMIMRDPRSGIPVYDLVIN